MKKVSTRLSDDAYIAEKRMNWVRYGLFSKDPATDVCSPRIAVVIVDVHTARQAGNCSRCPFFDDWAFTCTLNKWFYECIEERERALYKRP